LPGTAVAGEAAVDEIEALAVPGIAWRRSWACSKDEAPRLNAAAANAVTARRLKKYFIAGLLSTGR